MGNGTSMRVAALLPCLMLADCMQTGEEAAPVAVSAPAAAAPAASAVTSTPAARSSSVGGGARGGATTASARAEPVEVRPDALTQARADCWMKVETQRGLRSIDQRTAFVDKCVAEQIKAKPSP